MKALLKITASSLIRAIFISRLVFSMTFAASAILILPALWVPALIIWRYRLSTKSAILGVEPEVTFLIEVRLWSLSPGLIRSGE